MLKLALGNEARRCKIMLKFLVVAFLLGVMQGDLLAGDLWLYTALKFALPPIFFLGVYAYVRRSGLHLSATLMIGSAFLWGYIHNPSHMAPRAAIGQVIWVSGCSQRSDDLLVSVNGNIYRAIGQAKRGDLVEFKGGKREQRLEIFEQRNFSSDMSLWCIFGDWFRENMRERIGEFPSDIAAWLMAFILGDQADLDKRSLQTFRRIGLLHLLVLSGSHLSVMAVLMHGALKLPWHIFYVFGRLSPIAWLRVNDASIVLASFGLAVYSAAAGLSQSLQRALLGFVARFVPPMVGLSKSAHETLSLTILFQAIMFPANFLSITMLMSWSGVLVLSVFAESAFRKPLWKLVSDAALIQTVFFALSLLFFGQAGLVSIPANLFFHFVFAVLLPFDLLGLLCSWDSIDRLLVSFNREVLRWVDSVDRIQSTLPLDQVVIPTEITASFHLGKALVVLIVIGLFVLTGWRAGDECQRHKGAVRSSRQQPSSLL